MSKAIYALSWSAASQTYVLSGPQSGKAVSIALDSPAWFAWLAERSSFAFHGQVGSYTARLEAVQRGEHYWYAYLRIDKKLHKKYLGKTDDLSLARLEQVARSLHDERASAVSPGTALPAEQEQNESTRTSQSVTPAHKKTEVSATVVEGQTDVLTAMPSEPLHPLLSTKLHVPRLPARLVHRPRLIKYLKQGLSRTLILLCAPPGFGKTTLLAEFLSECGLPAVWLSLDTEDNDPLRFLSSLLAALQTHDPSLGVRAQALLSSPHGLQGLSLDAVFTLLINDLAGREIGEFLLVLDDYHTLTLDPIQHAIASLVEHCPPNLHLIIATRADPRLPLARLRAQGQLCEVRAADLQFDSAESRSFLHTVLERDLDASTIATILSRTEGWIAGLQLTALLLQGRHTEAEVRQFLADTLGSHRYLVDYLGEEVFSHQSEEVQSFLLHTCILERLSAPLCAALSGGSVDESAAMLAFLERGNLFLVPLDERCEWYRYHPLWASVLRVLLMRQRGAAGAAVLYGRASHWYEQHDLPSEAIEAAIQAGEFERAVQLIEQFSPLMLVRSQYYTLRRWIESLPHEMWATRPIVCLAYAWTLLINGFHGAYAAPLEEADRLFRGAANDAGLGMVETLRALAALMWTDSTEALRASREALALLPTGDLLLRGLSTSIRGGGYWLMGEVEAALRTLAEARRLHEQRGNMTGLLLNSMVLGSVLVVQGQLHEAADLYQQVIETAAERREYAIEATIRHASIFYEWNVFETVEAQLAGVIAESPMIVASTLLARGVLSLAYVVQARIRQAHGEHEAASALLRQAVLLAKQQRHPRFLAQAEAAQVRFWLTNGQVEAVTRWREGWVRTYDATPSYEDELDTLTLARVLIAQGEPEQALRLLDGFLAHARTQGRVDSELEILVLSALAEYAQGQTGQAVHLLQQALTLAEPQGYVRLFVDEGVPMLNLLRLVLSSWKGQHGADYVHRLLNVLQAEHPQQAEQLPKLQMPLSQRALDAHLHNLPVQPTRLIGREQEIAQIGRQLREPEVRLLTLTGPGGVGKTRLALQVAAELTDLFPNGISFVALASLNDPQLVVPTIAQTLEIGEMSDQPSLATLTAVLKEKQLLLLLDNFEQVVAAASDLAELLTACPNLKLLVTSRVGLHLRAEREFAVPPLTVPALKGGMPNLATLSQYEAVTLFIERAQAVKPDFQVVNDNAAAVVEICARLDGLPLAIELAAARSKTFSPQALLARLRHGLSVLSTQVRDLPTRQQTLQSTIAWSYDLLPVEEQQLFRRLAVFVDGCTCQVAEQVCTAASELEGDMLEMLASLVDKSLLLQVEQADGEVRFLMLQTLREYGLERLAAEEESETTHQAHADYYLALAQEAEVRLTGPEQAIWLECLEREHDNLRATLEWLVERTDNGQVEPALQLCKALLKFWQIRGYFREGRMFLDRVLAASKGMMIPERGLLLSSAGHLAYLLDDYDLAEKLLQESLTVFQNIGNKERMAAALLRLGLVKWAKNQNATASSFLQESFVLYEELDDKRGKADALVELGRVASFQGEYARAIALIEQSLELSRSVGDRYRLGYILYYLARVLFFSQGNQERIRALAEESLSLCQALSDQHNLGYVLSLLGQLEMQSGTLEQAHELSEHGVAILKEIGDRWGTAEALLLSARLLVKQENLAHARILYEESLTILRAIDYKGLMASCLEGLGQVLAMQGEPGRAARLWGIAEQLREEIGVPMPPVFRMDYEQAVNTARTQLGDQVFAAAWRQGRTLTPEQALFAQEAIVSPSLEAKAAPPARQASSAPAGLTARELDVLRLLAQGLTDAQIAEQLVIARRTVNWYLTSIYSKIGVSSRAAATRYALEQHLV